MLDLLTSFGLAATVLLVSALVAGVVERAPLSFPMIFLGIGLVLGQGGLGLLAIDAHSPTLEIVATLTLALVLFLDAARLDVGEMREQWLVPTLILGPGTLLTIALIAAAAVLLVGFGPVPALMVGAILSSTDPVMLRDVVRDERLPRSIRQTLKIEAGTNDIVVLPILLVLIAVAQARLGSAAEWAMFLARLLLLGPVVGFVVGGIGSWLINRVDARFPIRLEFQALYGIGLVLAAYVAGTAVGGDGFLAAFAAGLAVTALNQELCECFMDYGEVTAEMAMLLAFVLFGAVLSGMLLSTSQVPALLLALIAIFAIRPLVMALTLSRARISRAARGFIAWFGPRGLNSLLLSLLVVQAGLPGSEYLLLVVGVVVLVSAAVHGASATPLTGWYARRVEKQVTAEERESTVFGLFEAADGDVPRITTAELAERIRGEPALVVLDVRSRASHEQEGFQIPGSVRVLPDHVTEWAHAQKTRPRVVAYCT